MVNARLIAAGLLLFAGVARAEIIPAERLYDWSRANVGVPGGIPHRTTVFVDLQATGDSTYHCAADGVTDDSAHIQQALIDCPEGQVVYAPAGNYYVGSNIVLNYQQQKFTLRGDGMTGTGTNGTKFTAGPGVDKVFFFGGTPGDAGGWTGIDAGATKGSTQITVSSTDGFAPVGKALLILPGSEGTYPTWVHNHGDHGFETDQGCIVLITAKTATTIDFQPPLPLDWSANSPTAAYFYNGGLYNLVEGIGLEDFTVDMTAMSAGQFYQLFAAKSCWVKGVETIHAPVKQNIWTHVMQSEVRNCYFHDAAGAGSGHEGFALTDQCNWNLIENNIGINAGFPNFVVGDGAGTWSSGNVIGYNYASVSPTGDPNTAGAEIGFTHGKMSSFTLVEGNVVGAMIQVDGYHGSASHGVALRNRVFVDHPTATIGLRGFDLNHYSAYFSVVGNVVGTEGFSYTYDTVTRNYSNGIRLIRRLGYPNIGNTCYGVYGDGGDPTDACTENTMAPCRDVLPATSPPNYTAESFILGGCGIDFENNSQRLDKNVKATLIWHGNFDYAHSATIWDSGIADHNIPDSFIYSEQPTWWPDEISWPGVDQGSPTTGTNPAKEAYDNRDEDGVPLWYAEAGADPSVPTNDSVPSITGTATVGEVLTAHHGTWTGVPTPVLTRQWQSCNTSCASCSNLSGATGSTYTLLEADIGKKIRLIETATNTEGNASANSSCTATVEAAVDPGSGTPDASFRRNTATLSRRR